MRKNHFIIAIIAAALIGIFLGHYFTLNKKISPSEKITKKPLYWVDSMEPMIHYPGPGKSRMGMELTPVYPDNANDNNPSTIHISSSVINNLGVRIARVEQGMLARRIDTVGYIEPDENKISHIHTYAEGWVKKLLVKAVGEPVKNNQVILQLYSPLLVNVQEEYLIALASGNQSLIDASFKRLQAFHISLQQIQQLKITRKASQFINIVSHQNGVVTMLNVREGMHVTPETEIMSLADLSTIWMMAQIFEKQSSWVHIGEPAQAQLSAFPGKIWNGTVEYIYPQVDPMTRTLKVRFRFDNPTRILKPNMYASITLLAKPKQNVLSIPLEALIRSSQGDRVIVSLKNGHFQVRSVMVGMESGDRIEIFSGLHFGEAVVISGQFLIDSDANLKSGLERLQTPTEQTNIQPSSTKLNPVFEAQGIIKAINLSQHGLTLEHQAIPTLNWPAMTMDFSVMKNVSLDKLSIGDRVQFTLEKKEGHLTIITIQKLSK
jgi:Cu(I)/Ag(I) efflux system membrane fusion protein